MLPSNRVPELTGASTLTTPSYGGAKARRGTRYLMVGVDADVLKSVERDMNGGRAFEHTSESW